MLELLELDEVMGVRWVGGRVGDGGSTSLALVLAAYILQPVSWVVVVDGMRLELDAAGIDSHNLRTWCGIW